MNSSTTKGNFKQFRSRVVETFDPVDTVKGEISNSATELRLPKNLLVHSSFFVSKTEAQLRGGQVVSRTAVRTNYSTATRDYILGVTSLVTAPTIELPRPRVVGIGKTYIVKDEVGGAATTTITIRSGGEENIDGATTSTLTTNYQSRRYYTDGANWFTF